MPKEKIKSDDKPVYPGRTISAPKDRSEKQADAVADSVVNTPARIPANDPYSVKPVTATKDLLRTNHIQKQAEKEEEPAAKIQRQAEKEEEPAAKIQRQAEKEEEPAAKIQRQAEKEEEPAAKSLLHLSDNKVQPQVNLSQRNNRDKIPKATLNEMIKETKGLGMLLPDDIRSEMEKKFQADFSKVRIHTGKKAAVMANLIHAQAFTHGYDIYFNSGQYQPYSNAGKHLLAHELTHVVQQKGHGQ